MDLAILIVFNSGFKNSCIKLLLPDNSGEEPREGNSSPNFDNHNFEYRLDSFHICQRIKQTFMEHTEDFL